MGFTGQLDKTGVVKLLLHAETLREENQAPTLAQNPIPGPLREIIHRVIQNPGRILIQPITGKVVLKTHTIEGEDVM